MTGTKTPACRTVWTGRYEGNLKSSDATSSVKELSAAAARQLVLSNTHAPFNGQQ